MLIKKSYYVSVISTVLSKKISLTPLLRCTFEDIRDAEDAIYHLGRGIRLHGRDVEVEFAVGDRKSKKSFRLVVLYCIKQMYVWKFYL